jgi:thiol:disulfide interchange protein DsbD
MIRHIILAALFIAISALSAMSQATTKFNDLFSQGPKFLPQEQAFQFNFSQQQNRVILRWQISDGYYLYKDKFKITSPTTAITQVSMPKGSEHFDAYFGAQTVYYKALEFSFSVHNLTKNHEITLEYQGCADAGLCYPPSKISLFFDPSFITTQTLEAPIDALPAVSEQDQLASLLTSESLFWTLLAFFGLGIGLAFTPCVFPMYPILSGIIVGSGNKLTSRQALLLSFIYVQGMALTYTILGLVVASLGLQFQAAFQHPIVLGALAILFTGLAASMFGLINFQLPSAWSERLNAASNKQQGGKFVSVFVMGAISGLVASPCTTAPLSGVLIYVAQSGDLFLGGITLYALSLGMGIPLMLMGVSGGKLLPKAGAWMNVVKGTFGFMLLTVVIVLLSRFIDQQWVDLAWSFLAIVFAGYLLHHNQFTQASTFKSIRQTLVLLILIAASLFAAKPWFGSNIVNIGGDASTAQTTAIEFIQVKGYEALQAQLAIAKAAGKPAMIDFYADWCIACKDFEHKTFADPLIKPLLDNMVLIQSDVTANDPLDIEIQDKMRVLGLPTIILFDKNGIELHSQRVVGFQGPEQFKKTLDLVL